VTTLTIALQDRPHTRALLAGEVAVPGIVLQPVHAGPIVGAFRKMVRGLEFDVCELALTTYLCARRFGAEFTAIPVFPYRDFPQPAIRVRRESVPRGPGALAGGRIGVRAYTVTTGVWGRAVLADQLGLDLYEITWVVADEEHVTQYPLPANVEVRLGYDLDAMLAAGDLAATIGAASASPDVVALLGARTEALERDWLRQSVYPINHTVVVRDAVLAEHPQLAGGLYDAFAQAKQQVLDRLAGGQPADAAELALAERARFVGGDPLSYGIDANRPTLEVMARHALEQRILAEPADLNAVFAPCPVD
jgi:4,5-dihydroxyphthalate decarboxylase